MTETKVVVISALWAPKTHWPIVADEPGVKFYMLTDRTDVPEPWIKLPLYGTGGSSKYRTMTRLRITGRGLFDDAETSLWIDADIELRKPVTEVVTGLLGDHEIGAFAHPHRDCPYDDVCSTLRSRGTTITPKFAARAFTKMAELGMEPGTPVASCTVLARRNTEEMDVFNSAWLELVESLDDWKHQPSFNMALHQQNITCNIHPWMKNSIVQHTLRDYHLPPNIRRRNPQGRRAKERAALRIRGKKRGKKR